ncbi:MAG: hypothetical protein LBD63_03200 [Mycoplasmataceae bacterium]|nr:hypothetical protein [Mycoplasmataceae bacterium]
MKRLRYEIFKVWIIRFFISFINPRNDWYPQSIRKYKDIIFAVIVTLFDTLSKYK